jgi:hypothetical protein
MRDAIKIYVATKHDKGPQARPMKADRRRTAKHGQGMRGLARALMRRVPYGFKETIRTTTSFSGQEEANGDQSTETAMS